MALSSTMVGRCGRYEIHKISMNTQRRGKKWQLGVTVRSSEWFSAALSKDFPQVREYAYVYEVKAGSLADQAGVLVQDVLCSFGGETEPLGFTHDLLMSGNNNNHNDNNSQWNLLKCASFELAVGRAEYEPQFSFYVARKMATAKPGSTQKSDGALTLSLEISTRAQAYYSLDDYERMELLLDAKEDVRKQFEVERDAVLDALPEGVKDMFWQIGFVQWGRRNKSFLPVLIMSPYGVSPGKARDAWMHKFQQRKEKFSLEKMNFLVYWFGETLSSSSDVLPFSVVSQDSFISWEEAKARSLHRIPKKCAQKKKIAGLKQINEAARRSLSDRQLMLPPVVELHDLLCEADLAQHAISGAESSPDSSKSSPNSAKGRPSGRKLVFEPPTKRRRIISSTSRKADDKAEIESEQQGPVVTRSRLRLRLPTRAAGSPVVMAEVPKQVAAQPDAVPSAAAIPERVSPSPQNSSAGSNEEESSGVASRRRIERFLEASRAASASRKIVASSILSSTQVSDNDDSGSLEDEDRKPAAKSPAANNEGNHSTTGAMTVEDTAAASTMSVQCVLDSFCSKIQQISRRNAVLKTEQKQLEGEVKTWRDQYCDLGGVVSGNGDHVLRSTEIGSKGDDEVLQSFVAGGDNYLESMHEFVGKIAKQNTDLASQNSRLEVEVEAWRGKVKSLVQKLKQR